MENYIYKEDFTMEDMNARVMENEELDEVTEVDEAVESGNAGALVAGVVGGFLAYAMIGGVKKLWGFVGTKLAERKAAEKAKTEVVDAEYTEVVAEDSDEEDSEK
jgi:hypothetical protein|uniref:Protein tyrosine kinase n=1 Tax=Siphoviridae sp. ctEBu1 TaxID=2825393 RepID=A0A8S5QH41_9CAUD|nr:MAG TPA: protein tyrosine kinase [Siphoviridae sp. ctEBu1]